MKEFRVSVPAMSGHAGNFDVLRLLFAISVLFAHSFALLGFADPVQALVRTTNPGSLAVDGFFLISGYLITRSWVDDPSIGRFLARRILRLYPGFIVASLISVLMVGPLGADAGPYFHALDPRVVLRDLLLLHEPQTPRVFAGTAVESVNGSMWTIAFEFRCYLLAVLFGCLGLLGRRRVFLSIVLVAGAAISYTVPEIGPTDSQHLLFGLNALRVSDSMAWFATLFMAGSCFFLFRERIHYSRTGCAIAFAVFVWSLFYPALLRPGILLAGAYVVFAIASMPRSRRARGGHVDLSYGMYLYGWPVQKLLSWYWPKITPWPMFVATLALSAGLGWLSWRLVEQPALRLKPGHAKRQRFAAAAADPA